MPINLTVAPVDSVAVCYFQDGSSFTVNAGEEKSVQYLMGFARSAMPSATTRTSTYRRRNGRSRSRNIW